MGTKRVPCNIFIEYPGKKPTGKMPTKKANRKNAHKEKSPQGNIVNS